MDSLKTLMDKKQYDLVLKLTENSQDSLALFYRLSAMLATGKSEEALNLIKEKRQILLTKPGILMKIHIEILCLLGRFDEAYSELRYYQELPYENQETEEILNYLPKYIREEEIKVYRHKEVGQDELRQKLLSKNDADVLSALDAVRSMPLDSFLLPIFNILSKYPRQMVRAFALLLLVAKKYDKKVSYLYFDKLIEVVPSELEEPFVLPSIGNMEDISSIFQNVFHDPSLSQNAVNILSSYLIYTFPNKPTYTREQVLAIFGYLAKDLLKVRGNNLEEMCDEYGLDVEETRAEVNKIKAHLDDF